MKKNNTKLILVFVIFLILIASAISFYKQEGAQPMFAHPEFARYELAPTPSWEGVTTGKVEAVSYFSTKAKTFINCGKQENTDKCRIYIKSPEAFGGGQSSIQVYYTICNKFDGKECGSYTLKQIGSQSFHELESIDEGQSMGIYLNNLVGKGLTGTYKKEYRPWKIYRFDGGAKFEVKADSSCFSSNPSLLNDVPSKEKVPNCLTKTGGLGSRWVNYISHYGYGREGRNIVYYKGRKVYCRAGMIYEIATLTLKDGRTIEIDPNYKKPDDAPEYFETIGERIDDPNIECCPNEIQLDMYCGDDFKWHKGTEGRPCRVSSTCSNMGLPIPTDSTHYKQELCVNGHCKWTEPKEVECTTNSACPNGEICDLSLSNYGHCIQQKGDHYCGDGICQRDESWRCEDCKLPTKKGFNLNNYMPYIIAGILVIILVALLRPTKKK